MELCRKVSAKSVVHAYRTRDPRLEPEKDVGFLAKIRKATRCMQKRYHYHPPPHPPPPPPPQDARRSKIIRQRAWVQRAWDGAGLGCSVHGMVRRSVCQIGGACLQGKWDAERAKVRTSERRSLQRHGTKMHAEAILLSPSPHQLQTSPPFSANPHPDILG